MNQHDDDLEAARELAAAIESTDGDGEAPVEEHLDDAGHEQEPAPKKKKSKVLPVLMGLGAVLLLSALGGGYYYQEILVPQQKAEMQRKQQEAERLRLQKEAEMAAPAPDAASSPDGSASDANPLANDLPGAPSEVASSPVNVNAGSTVDPLQSMPTETQSAPVAAAPVRVQTAPAVEKSMHATTNNVSLDNSDSPVVKAKPKKKKKTPPKVKPVEITPEDNGYTKLF